VTVDIGYSTDGYELDPCPFCCSTRVDLFGDHVECEHCMAGGPQLSDWKIAVRAWNEIPRPGNMKAQRARWKGRLRAEARRKKQRLAGERRRKRPEAERDREYRKWASEREACLRRPVPPDA